MERQQKLKFLEERECLTDTSRLSGGGEWSSKESCEDVTGNTEGAEEKKRGVCQRNRKCPGEIYSLAEKGNCE